MRCLQLQIPRTDPGASFLAGNHGRLALSTESSAGAGTPAPGIGGEPGVVGWSAAPRLAPGVPEDLPPPGDPRVAPGGQPARGARDSGAQQPQIGHPMPTTPLC